MGTEPNCFPVNASRGPAIVQVGAGTVFGEGVLSEERRRRVLGSVPSMSLTGENQSAKTCKPLQNSRHDTLRTAG